ncbi:hypothetical protein GCM10009416_45670 [Craurococcus roseus]|uniref:Uncharacterized protein n=1 Tax=Craurococcus roseus TaxID=77585 RepID=A0ABN1G2E7_9PROT
MREAVYLIPVMAGAAPAGASKAYKPHPHGPERPRTPTSDVPSAAKPRQDTPSAPRDRTSGTPDLWSAGSVLGGAQGALARGLRAGRKPADAGGFDLSASPGQAARLVGGAAPSLKASANTLTTVRKSNFPILNVNLAVAQRRRLDAPASGTHPDRAIDPDNFPAASPGSAPRALCGGTSPFDAPL